MPQPTAEVAAGLRQHAGTPPAPRALVIAVLENPADESAIVALESQPDSNLHSEVVEVLVGQFALLHASRPDRVLELQIRLLEQTSRGAGVDLCTAFDNVRRLPGLIDYLEAVILPAYWDATAWPEGCARIEGGEIRCI